MKVFFIFITVSLVLVVILPITYYGYYHNFITRANSEHFDNWYTERYYKDSFNGVVYSIETYDGFYVVCVNVENESDRIFNVCQDYVSIKKGDSISKKMDNYSLYLITKELKEEIKLSFCK